jgi:hypothetical protein
LIVLHDIDELPRGLRFTLAIGTFDGVHRGHRKVVAALTRAARRLGTKSVALTFDPHPSAVLRDAAPPALCDLEERLEWLSSLDVNICVVQKFDRAFSEQSPRAFLERIGRGRDLSGVVMTPESAFGRDRAGGLEQMRALSPELGFEIVEVGRLENQGAGVSSTLRAYSAVRTRSSARWFTATDEDASSVTQRPTCASSDPSRCHLTGSMPCASAGAAAGRSIQIGGGMALPRSECGQRSKARANDSSRSFCSISTRTCTASVCASSSSAGCAASGNLRRLRRS